MKHSYSIYILLYLEVGDEPPALDQPEQLTHILALLKNSIEQLTQIKRVRPAPARVDGPASGHAMDTIGARMQKTRMDCDIIALRVNWLTDRVARASSLIYRAVEPGQQVYKQIENCTASNVRPSRGAKERGAKKQKGSSQRT
jgi:hypothetical protein